ncbi:MAG TPA: NCS2 family permease [Solirubrobacteraceae bacterium]|nr:NCS2 family permease [Solirubrobacteraceae bacterium]
MAADSFLERRFRLSERGTSVRVEALGGLTTFLTMAYIVFVNPAILSAAGMPFGAVAVATALAAAVASIAMGLYANVPFALASGLGINALVAFDLILGQDIPWQVGMACVIIEGVIAVILVLAGLREAVVRAVPMSLKLSIGVGIGLFITFVGLREGGIVVNDPATSVTLADLTAGPPLIALAGVAVALGLSARGVRGAILIGIFTSTILGLIFGVLNTPDAILDIPGGDELTTIGEPLQWDYLGDAFSWALVPIIFALFMTDFFDTVGTAVAVGEQGGLNDENGELPEMRKVLLVDSASAAGGGIFGVSSVTTYVESGAGVGEGARTGLAAVFTGLFFALTVFAVPLVETVGQGVQYGAEDNFIHPAIAPALIMVGALMIRLVAGIDWAKPEEAIPAFLIIAGVPLTFSIAAGIGLGIIGYVVVMASLGRAREVHPLMWVLVPLFLAFFADDWLSANVF